MSAPTTESPDFTAWKAIATGSDRSGTVVAPVLPLRLNSSVRWKSVGCRSVQPSKEYCAAAGTATASIASESKRLFPGFKYVFFTKPPARARRHLGLPKCDRA